MDNTAHVFVRKKNASNDWLLTAWTSADTNQSVTVTVPTLGTVTLNARTNGAVYVGTSSANLILQDTNGLQPTQWRSSIPAPADPVAPSYRLRHSGGGSWSGTSWH